MGRDWNGIDIWRGSYRIDPTEYCLPASDDQEGTSGVHVPMTSFSAVRYGKRVLTPNPGAIG
jgi:hypothetical protein